ncbi:hypothetical protein MCOR25_004141 [Pyricularia grisea]|uniref:Uncharacterized protein n=1 Tax=Pyricularia grisea TaxID=148305 RepID=A0A6P8APH8_PYRGI|nr:hypothetical protein PgNI_11254 [Pyricularia grisea]KAI6370597.1 hypothetical protein MCOR25_004141 [Pyricularia grisea]TLD03928.1 hypothetical protein PgNI_11254 [Pyricularia grisea]
MAPLSPFVSWNLRTREDPEQRYPIRVPSFGGDYIFHTTSREVFEFLEAGKGYCQIPEEWHAAANLPHVPCIRSLGIANLTWYSIAKIFIAFIMLVTITLLICWICGRMGWCFSQPRSTTRRDQGVELRMLGANRWRQEQQQQQHMAAGDQETVGGITTSRLRDWRNRHFHRARDIYDFVEEAN